MLRAHLLPAIALAGFAASSFASTTTYTSSASFMSQVAPGSYTETFNDFDDSQVGAVPFSGGGFTYTIFAPSDLYGSGEFVGSSLPNEALTITFTSGNVTAVGGNFYVSNFSDVFQSVAVTLTLNDGTTVSFTPTSVLDSFRGFTSDIAITSLVMSAPGAQRYAGVDNLTVGISAVPEPATWLLMALGVGGLLAARRRAA